MSDKKPSRPIVIDKVHEDRGKSGKDLKYCFFLPTEIEGFYNFFDEHGRTLATGVSSDKPFPFLLDGHAWTIQMGKITDSVATGSWTNSAPTLLTPAHPGLGEEQDGSFQASSSGGAADGEASFQVLSIGGGDGDASFQGSSSGGGDGDAGEEIAPPAPPVGAIEIKTVTGTSDKDKLKGCYFLANGTTYSLYNKNDVLLKSGISSGTFTFQHDSKGPSLKITWTITGFVISPTAASANWSNDDVSLADEQSGSFQASSGGGLGEGQVASAASAK